MTTNALWTTFTSDYVANCRAWTHFPGNPILPPSGTGWQRRWTANPDLLTFQGKTLLYYRGNGTLGADPDEPTHDRIGVALVEEIGPGVLRLGDLAGGQPVIDVGPAGAFDCENVLDPGTVIFQDKVWLYYTSDGPGHVSSIGLAVSEDGVQFEKVGRILAGRTPELVVNADGSLSMLYQTFDPTGNCSLHLATSTDGINFMLSEIDPIYPRPKGQWDSFSITTARIYEPGDGWYYLIYGGSAYLADEPDYFGLARSHNLIDWEPHPGNPIFGCGAKAEPDGAALWFPALYETDNKFIMLYEGSRGKYTWDLHSTICMAWINKRS